MFPLPKEASERSRALQPVGPESLRWVRYNPWGNLDNNRMLDEDTAIAEAALYKRAGGGTIVDVTTIGIGRDPLALARIARATGLNIVMGAGYYVGDAHPDGMDRKTDSDLAQEMIEEIAIGVGDTGVKAGIIGEIGCSWPMTDNERKVLRGAARAQQDTGASLLIHPGRNEAAPFEILELVAEAGADLERVVMAHVDRTIQDIDMVLELAQRGCYLEYDLFGWEGSYLPLSRLDMPNDGQRFTWIERLLQEGYAPRLLLAHDVCHKHQLTKYGGHGYAHILENIVPRLRDRGFSPEDIDRMIVANPADVLTFQ